MILKNLGGLSYLFLVLLSLKCKKNSNLIQIDTEITLGMAAIWLCKKYSEACFCIMPIGMKQYWNSVVYFTFCNAFVRLSCIQVICFWSS